MNRSEKQLLKDLATLTYKFNAYNVDEQRKYVSAVFSDDEITSLNNQLAAIDINSLAANGCLSDMAYYSYGLRHCLGAIGGTYKVKVKKRTLSKAPELKSTMQTVEKKLQDAFGDKVRVEAFVGKHYGSWSPITRDRQATYIGVGLRLTGEVPAKLDIVADKKKRARQWKKQVAAEINELQKLYDQLDAIAPNDE